MKNLSVMLWTAVSAFCDTTTYLFTLYRREKKRVRLHAVFSKTKIVHSLSVGPHQYSNE